MRFTTMMQDERGFVHKRLLGIGKGLVGTALGFIPGIGGALQLAQRARQLASGFGRPAPTPTLAPPRGLPVTTQPQPPVPSRHRPSVPLPLSISLPSIPDIIEVITDIIPGGGGSPIPGSPSGFANGGACKPPNTMVGDICVAPGTPAGPPGEAVMGRFGAALEPTFQTINKRVCLPGMVLGKPDVGGLPLCYNVGAISNKERLWPKGAAPLLTGGEMSAIRKAATAAGKFQRAGKRLAAVGKTFSGPAGRRAPARRLTAGRTVKVLESGPGSVQL